MVGKLTESKHDKDGSVIEQKNIKPILDTIT